MIRSFGQTMVGDIKNYAPVTDEMLTHPAGVSGLSDGGAHVHLNLRT